MSAALATTSILETELHRRQIKLNSASVPNKLEVFYCTVDKMITLFNAHAPREFTEAALEIIEKDLIVINSELWKIRRKNMAAKSAQPHIKKALNRLNTAIKMFDKDEESRPGTRLDTQFDSLDNCVAALEKASEYLKG